MLHYVVSRCAAPACRKRAILKTINGWTDQQAALSPQKFNSPRVLSSHTVHCTSSFPHFPFRFILSLLLLPLFVSHSFLFIFFPHFLSHVAVFVSIPPVTSLSFFVSSFLFFSFENTRFLTLSSSHQSTVCAVRTMHFLHSLHMPLSWEVKI